jgi:hypothetical protein
MAAFIPEESPPLVMTPKVWIICDIIPPFPFRIPKGAARGPHNLRQEPALKLGKAYWIPSPAEMNKFKLAKFG